MPVVIDGTTGIDTIQNNTVTSAKIVDGSVAPIDTQVGALPSMVRLNTANGVGSTNTKIRRFTNVVTNQGSDITYADSATLGASFTINTNGVYAISFTDALSAAGNSGISLNTTAPNTVVYSIPVAEQLSWSGSGPNVLAQWTGYLLAGSVVRPHIDGQSTGAPTSLFTIVRVA